VFTRGSKRTKTAPAEQEQVGASTPGPKKSRKGKEEKERDDEPVRTAKKPTVRKMDFTTPKPDRDAIKLPKRRKGTRPNESSRLQSGTDVGDYDTIDVVRTPDAEEKSKSTMISLPFSDTPIINRNKELRKKGNATRRSSMGMRGRRASSLIENGHSAMPHREVESSEFYKHIEGGALSEPRRMRQLLTWTGERALGDKPSHGDPDSAAHLAGKHVFPRLQQTARLTATARVIKESLLKDFANKSEFSNWFSREDSAPAKIIKKPNPRNVEIEENLAGLEARIKRYV
jgi:kinetochore protein Mis13/DSN1